MRCCCCCCSCCCFCRVYTHSDHIRRCFRRVAKKAETAPCQVLRGLCEIVSETAIYHILLRGWWRFAYKPHEVYALRQNTRTTTTTLYKNSYNSCCCCCCRRNAQLSVTRYSIAPQLAVGKTSAKMILLYLHWVGVLSCVEMLWFVDFDRDTTTRRQIDCKTVYCYSYNEAHWYL